MAFPGKLYRDGTTLKQQNVSGTLKLFFVEQFGFNNFLNDEILGWIDTLAKVGANGMRVFGIWPFAKGNEEEPWIKTGNKYDLNQFNARYFEHLQTWVDHAEKRGVAILFELFDSCGIWNASYAPYNPFYPIVGSNHKAFSDLNNRTLLEIQKRYVKKVIETVRPRLNVIFGVMNEFMGDIRWHQEISGYVKSLAPDNLIAGSHHGSPAANDPNVDLWFVHKGRYDMSTGTSYVREDINDLRGKAGNQKALGYSTDGFGQSGKFRENPTDMRSLAFDVVNNGLQLLGFLDHHAYNQLGGGSVSQLNIATYQAIVDVFQPHPLPQKGPKYKLDEHSFISLKKKDLSAEVFIKLKELKNIEYQTDEEFENALNAKIGEANTTQYKDLIFKYAEIGRPPAGFLDVFKVATLPSTHPKAVIERGGKAIHATTEQGFLCYGQYRKGYPTIPLQAVFSVLIDNNTADDRNILIFDVYDHHSDRVIGKALVTRKDFPKANELVLFKFDFTPPSENANMEFRIYYMGQAYVLADKIAVIDPAEVTIQTPQDIPETITPSPTPGPPGPTPSGALVIDDPLTTGQSVGMLKGGVFTSEGYKITTTFDGYIVYQTEIVKNIRIEFDAKGYLSREDFGENKMTVMEMYDADPFTNWYQVWQTIDSFLYQIRKRGYDPQGIVTDALDFKFGCHVRGVGKELKGWRGHCLAGHPIEWDPNKLYHWEISVSNGFTEIIRNGQKMYSVDCSRDFAPDKPLVVCIGGTTYGRGGPRNVTYSNVKIYRL